VKWDSTKSGRADPLDPINNSISRRPMQPQGQVPRRRRPKAPQVRNLDPHLDISNVVPTKRMHANWPECKRRQLARHFYGMSPEQILAEEEKERLREQRKYVHKSQNAEEEEEENSATAEDDDNSRHGDRSGGRPPLQTTVNARESLTASQMVDLRKAKMRREALEQSLARGVEDGRLAYGLEIRIRNGNWSERVVVGRNTPRVCRAWETRCC
jgi:hypothetical protein